MSTSSILSIVGYAVGTYFGYPQLGAIVGGMVGAQIDAANMPTSRLQDLSAARVSLGAPISVLYGHPRVGGNIAWCSPAIGAGKVGGAKGGDGGGTETYVRHVLIILGEGETGPPTRIWVGGKLVYNRLATADDESIDTSLEEGVIGEVIHYAGSATQLPDPTYAGYVGEENAIAYRGKTTVLLKDFSCGTSGQLQPTTIEVGGKQVETDLSTTRILTEFAPSEILLEPATGSFACGRRVRVSTLDGASVGTHTGNETEPQTDEIPDGVVRNMPGTGNGDTALVVFGLAAYGAGFAWAGSGKSGKIFFADAGHRIGDAHIRFSVQGKRIAVGTSADIGQFADEPAGAAGNPGFVYLYNLETLALERLYDPEAPVESLALLGQHLYLQLADTGEIRHVNGGLNEATFAVPATGSGHRIFPGQDGHLYCADSVADIHRWNPTTEAWDFIIQMLLTGADLGTNNCTHNVSSIGDVYALEMYTKTEVGSRLEWFWSFGGAGAYYPSLEAAIGATSFYVWEAVNNVGVNGIRPRRNPTMAAPEVYPFEPPSFPLQADVLFGIEYYYWPGELIGDPYGTWEAFPSGEQKYYQQLRGPYPIETYFHHVYRTRLTPLYDLTEPTLQQVVEDLCTRAGLLPVSVDATELATQSVHAFAITQIGPTSSALELLMSVYRFYCVESGGKLVFRFLGAESVRSIPHADLGASWADPHAMPLPMSRGNPQELPSMESVRYANIDDDYQDGLESSDRLLQSVQSARTVEYAIGMHPDEAKQLAAVTQQVAQTSLVRIGPVALGPEHREIEAGDIITPALAGGGSIQMLVASSDYDRGILTLEGVRCDAADYTSDAVTANDYAPAMTVRRLPDTLAAFVDPPLWADAYDGASFWVAATPSRRPWPGYSLQRSATDIGYTEVHRDGRAAVLGACSTTLAAWPGGQVVDWVSTLTVDVGAGQLASITRAELLGTRANLALVGAEMLQFQTAELVAPGVFVLTGFARYLGGTEAAVHTAGERFVLLDVATLTRVPMALADQGMPAYYRAVTLGRALETAESQVFAPDLVSLKPLAPATLRAIRLPGGDLSLHWRRRTRLRSNALRGIVPLGEASEAYTVDVMDGATRLRRIDTTAPLATYTQAQQTVDGVGSSGYRIDVRQVGQVQGHPATLEI